MWNATSETTSPHSAQVLLVELENKKVCKHLEQIQNIMKPALSQAASRYLKVLEVSYSPLFTNMR